MNQEGTGVPEGGGSGGGNYYYQDGEYYIGTANDGTYGQATIVPDISQSHLSFPIPHASQYAAAPMGSYQSNPMSYET